jgi:hypothetical protein
VRHQRTRGENYVIFNDCALHNNGSHTDQDSVANGASVKGDTVSDGDVFADDQRPAFRVKRPGVGDVQYAVILDAGPGSNSDLVHVTSDRNLGPYTDVLA